MAKNSKIRFEVRLDRVTRILPFRDASGEPIQVAPDDGEASVRIYRGKDIVSAYLLGNGIEIAITPKQTGVAFMAVRLGLLEQRFAVRVVDL